MRRLAALAAAAVLLTGCGADQPDPIEGAEQLAQNIPQDLDDHQVVAYNMTDDSGVVSVDGEADEVSVGSVVTVGDVEYEVVQIVPDSGEGEGPDGWISIRER